MSIRQLEKSRVGSVGARTPLIDGVDKVTGKARYTSDLLPRGALCGRVLRSPVPHARPREASPRASFLTGKG